MAAALETAEALHVDAPFSAAQIRAFVDRFVAGDLVQSADAVPTAVPTGAAQGTTADFGALVAAMAADGSIETEAWAMATVDDRVMPATAPHCAEVRRWCGAVPPRKPAFIAARKRGDRMVGGVSMVGAGI